MLFPTSTTRRRNTVNIENFLKMITIIVFNNSNGMCAVSMAYSSKVVKFVTCFTTFVISRTLFFIMSNSQNLQCAM